MFLITLHACKHRLVLVYFSAPPSATLCSKALPVERANRFSIPDAAGSAVKAAPPLPWSGSPQASGWRELSLPIKEEKRFAHLEALHCH